MQSKGGVGGEMGRGNGEKIKLGIRCWDRGLEGVFHLVMVIKIETFYWQNASTERTCQLVQVFAI